YGLCNSVPETTFVTCPEEVRMSDALPIPPAPSIEQYRKLANDFQDACESSEAGAVVKCVARWLEAIGRLQGLEITSEVREQIDRQAKRIEQRWCKSRRTDESEKCDLAEVGLFVAREHGFASWPDFAEH